MFSWEDFLKTAETLKDGTEADKRSAVSRAYYSCFHVVMEWLSDRGHQFTGHGTDHELVAEYLDRVNWALGQKFRRLKRSRRQVDYELVVDSLDNKVRTALAAAKHLVGKYSDR